MILKKMVCGVVSAKKLKKLGVDTDSCFKWIKFEHSKEWKLVSEMGKELIRAIDILPAFTTDELGELLQHTNIPNKGTKSEAETRAVELIRRIKGNDEELKQELGDLLVTKFVELTITDIMDVLNSIESPMEDVISWLIDKEYITY